MTEQRRLAAILVADVVGYRGHGASDAGPWADEQRWPDSNLRFQLPWDFNREFFRGAAEMALAMSERFPE